LPSNFIDSESGVTICNQFRIRRRHRARDIRLAIGRCLPIGDHFEHSLYLQTFRDIGL